VVGNSKQKPYSKSCPFRLISIILAQFLSALEEPSIYIPHCKYKGFLLLVIWVHKDLMIHRVSVKEVKKFKTYYGVH
jgi:hypothetical protein